jgi:hypothetical protein
MEVSVELTVKDSPYSRARHIKLRKFYLYNDEQLKRFVDGILQAYKQITESAGVAKHG